MRLPDLDAALAALCLDLANPAHADDIEVVTAVWSRRTLGPLLGPQEPIDPLDPPTLRSVPPPR